MKRTILGFLLVVGSLSLATSISPAKAEDDAWAWLHSLLLLPGVSEHEAKVADYVEASLPDDIEHQRDDMDNVWFTVGEGRPHLVFVAHTDELGLVVTGVTEQGRLKVEGRGGFLPQMYEGRPVVVYTAGGPVNGIVAPRKGYTGSGSRRALLGFPDMFVYLGVESAEDASSLGVEVGDFITIRKQITELSPELICARAVDDRAGCAVLLAAAHRIRWSRVKGKTVTFAWDVQEETGLVGAGRLAKQLGADYVFPVDTFVSTDGPLDEKRYARIPLGEGLVLRGMDSSTIAPRFELDKVMAMARKRGIPYQLGNTGGSTDGTRFITEGAVSLPMGWPGTYSHSFIEKVHRKDLQALTDMVVALVVDFQ